jgi:glycosyltransferase involved in cell wall biosynthesis
MRYCFLTYGAWEKNAGLLRPRELGAELIRQGHQVIYLIDDYPPNHQDLGLSPGAKVEFVPHPRSLRQIAERWHILARIQPDYVHVLNLNAKTVLALARVGRPCHGQRRGLRARVVAEWDEPPFLKDLPWPKAQLYRALDCYLRRRADVYIVCTRYLQEYFRTHWGIDAAYIPHATYLPQYADGPSPYAAPTAVYMGQMYPLWDLDLLFDAALLLAREGFKPPMAFVGDGPDLPKWTQFVKDHKLDNITLSGYRRGEELWRYLRHAHVLMFPIRPTLVNQSRCPSKTFAYAQSRRPILTNRVGEVAQLLGDKATYVEATPAGFAAGIRQAMSTPALSDVDYQIEKHNYRDRTRQLLEAIEKQGAGGGLAALGGAAVKACK